MAPRKISAASRTRTPTPEAVAAPTPKKTPAPPKSTYNQPIRANLTEIGSTGLTQIGNIIGDLYETIDLNFVGPQWRNTIKKMMDTDATIGAVLFAIEMLMRQVEWSVQPADDSPEAAEYAMFVESCLSDMSMSWHDTLSEILTFLPYGFSFHEIVYKRRLGPNPKDGSKNSNYNDGRIGWRKWPIRGQVTLDHWDFDEDGGIRGMYQRLANFELVYIPIEKGLLFRTTSRMNSPEGRSILLNAYRSWYFRKHIENIEGIGIERDLAGMPVAYVPWQMLTASATDEQKQIVSVIQKIVTNIKRDEQEGIVFPVAYDDKGNKEFDLKLLATGGSRQFSTNEIIDRYGLQIAMTMLADFVFLGHKGVGSFALSSNKMHFFSSALKSWLDSIAAVINAHAIPRLMILNGFPTSKSPVIVHEDIENAPLGELGGYIEQLAKAGLLNVTPELQRYLLEAANLPAPRETLPATMVQDRDEESGDDNSILIPPGNIPPPERVDQSPQG